MVEKKFEPITQMTMRKNATLLICGILLGIALYGAIAVNPYTWWVVAGILIIIYMIIKVKEDEI